MEYPYFEIKTISKFGNVHTTKVFGMDENTCIKAVEIATEGKFQSLKKLGFFNPDDYVTKFDNMQTHIKNGYPKKQYEKNLAFSHADYDYCFLTWAGSWGLTGSRRNVTAYETIGLHAHTSELIRGFLDNNWAVIDYRSESSTIYNQDKKGM